MGERERVALLSLFSLLSFSNKTWLSLLLSLVGWWETARKGGGAVAARPRGGGGREGWEETEREEGEKGFRVDLEVPLCQGGVCG